MAKNFIAAYYYPGWHHCPIRDASFPGGWSEWDLVYRAQPRFDGHNLPLLPLWGREDESDPAVFARKIDAAHLFGIDAFVFAFYWSRGRRLLESALKKGLLGSTNRQKIRFALMWANRMPRRVMPVKNSAAAVIDPSRLVYTDPADFLEFVATIADEYFTCPEYFELNGGKYLSIFDTAFFLKQLEPENARLAITRARDFLAARNMRLHLAAIDPIPEHRQHLKAIGFDSVTHYVFLPDWKGPLLQDYNEYAKKRQPQWQQFSSETGLEYFPSVATGWDANPRGSDHGREKPGKYPWSPIIVNRSPKNFGEFLGSALNFLNTGYYHQDRLCMIASWNEWSEGHYLEPDEKEKFAWLESVRNARSACGY